MTGLRYPARLRTKVTNAERRRHRFVPPSKTVAAGTTPPAIGTGLKCWGDASISGQFVIVTGHVDVWGDTGSPARMIFPSTSGTGMVMGTSHGLTSVQFGSGDGFMLVKQTANLSNDYTPGVKPYSYMVYCECTNSANTWNDMIGHESMMVRLQGSDNLLSWDGTSTTAAFTKNVLHAVGGIGNGASSSQWLDGTKIGTASNSEGNASGGGFWIGGPGNHFVGHFIRYAFYEAALSDANMVALSSWAVNG